MTMNQNVQGNTIKESLNKIYVVGDLVKNGLTLANEGEENECVRGSLILRTEDKSEIEINYFANKYKKKDGNFTNETNSQFDTLVNVMESYVDMSNASEGEEVTTVKIGAGSIRANDYINKDGILVSGNRYNASFANKLDTKDLELNPKNAKFEVSGVIENIEQELKNGNLTGNNIISLNIIGYNGSIIPVKLTIPQDLVQPFSSAGFFVGSVGRFNGNIVNATETYMEQQSFGDPVPRTRTKRMLEIRGGSPLTLDGLGITNEQYEMCKNKRQAHLNEIRTKAQGGQQNGSTQNAFGQPPVQNANNPFGQAQVNTNNPFGGQQNVNNTFGGFVQQ